MTTFSYTAQRSGRRFSDTALILLGRAADREDQMLLPIPKSVKAYGVVLDRVFRNLLERGFIEEISVRAPVQAWRSNINCQFGLRITAAGLKAVGVPALMSGVPLPLPDREPSTPARAEASGRIA